MIRESSLSTSIRSDPYLGLENLRYDQRYATEIPPFGELLLTFRRIQKLFKIVALTGHALQLTLARAMFQTALQLWGITRAIKRNNGD